MRRKITLAFLILAAFLLQTTVFQYFQIASVTPNLLLILTSAFGLMRRLSHNQVSELVEELVR